MVLDDRLAAHAHRDTSSSAAMAVSLGGLAGVGRDEPLVTGAPRQELFVRAVVDAPPPPRGRRPRRRAGWWPCGRRRRARWCRCWPHADAERMACSTLGSTAEVASSRISSCGSRITARARRDALSLPSGEAGPALPHVGVESVAEVADKAGPLRHVQRSPDRRRRRGRGPSVMLPRTLSSNMNVCWATRAATSGMPP